MTCCMTLSLTRSRGLQNSVSALRSLFWLAAEVPPQSSNASCVPESACLPQNRIQGFGSTNASDPIASSSYNRPSSSSGGFSSSTCNGAAGGMVGFGNPRFNNAKPSSGPNPSKWLPTNLANKLDSLNVLPKDRKGGLRHSEVGLRPDLIAANQSIPRYVGLLQLSFLICSIPTCAATACLALHVYDTSSMSHVSRAMPRPSLSPQKHLSCSLLSFSFINALVLSMLQSITSE